MQVWQDGNGPQLALLHQPQATRSLDFLQQYGKCLDHIRPGRSTIRQAGHGAFATRNLPAGTVITASPLHVVHERFMEMYRISRDNDNDNDSDSDHSQWLRHLDQVQHYQLLYNYCFGHADSTMLLCPYGAGINYLNHANAGNNSSNDSSNNNNNKNAPRVNVAIRWATNFEVAHNASLLLQDYPFARGNDSNDNNDDNNNNKPRLALDYVATRDIAEGEELFMDYGMAWQEAWEEHVRNYEASSLSSRHYSSARHFNQVFFSSDSSRRHNEHPLRTVTEQQWDPYPENLQMRCHANLLLPQPKKVPPRGPNSNNNNNNTNNTDSYYQWESNNYGEPCRVLDRFQEAGETWYTVQIELRYYDYDDDNDNVDNDNNMVTWVEQTDVPRMAIRFFDLPGTTDIHLPNAFRHPIHIPDDMFPQQWRDLAA